MDILMIGHSGSGKTTYMAGLYSRMKIGVAGLTINSNFSEYMKAQWNKGNYSYSYSDFLKQDEGLDRLSNDLFKGRYPDPTMIRQEYYFNLVCSGHNIPFNWYDYRGGVLMERSTNSNDAKDLINKIRNSDALIVFLDGDTLFQSLDNNSRQYKRLISCVNNAISNVSCEDGVYYPISFVITKGDLYENYDFFETEGFDYFRQNLFVPMSKNKSVMGLITVTEVNRNNIYNVHFPLLFSVFHGLYNYAKKVEQEYEREKRNRSIWEDIKEFFTDEKMDAFNATITAISNNFDLLKNILTESENKSIITF